MKIQLSFIYLTLNLISCLSTEVDEEDDFETRVKEARQHLHKMAVLRPTTSEINIALSNSNVSRDIEVKRLQEFFYFGQYPVDFIQLLNSYRTLSYDPIELSNDEITILNSNYVDGLKKNRILTQLKFYRKIQEIQCTNCVLLKNILPKVERYLDDIASYVYNMIEMSYRGKFIVSAWLWNLHIQLLGLQHETLQTQKFLNKRLPEINGILQKLITTCQENKYLMKNFNYTLNYYNKVAGNRLLPDTFLKMYDEKYKRFNEKQDFKLSIGFNHLVMPHICLFPNRLIQNIPGLVYNWKNASNELRFLSNQVKNQYKKDEWTAQPIIFIKYQRTVLNILKATFYCYIWVNLGLYQKIVASTLPSRTLANTFKEMFGTLWKTSNTNEMFHSTVRAKLQREYDGFLYDINKVLGIAYFEDQIFNEVLILLSEIYEPDDKKIDTTIDILANAVNDIMRSYTESSNEYEKAIINFDYDEQIYGNLSKLLKYNRQSFKYFFLDIERKIEGLKLSHLLFYIIGINTTHFVFPNN